MSKRFDELFRDIVDILQRDYAGSVLTGPRIDPKYYNQAIGQAWHDRRLDDLQFFRFINQMLACTGDRHLRFTLRPGSSYTPYSPGFLTRRFGDSLYVTAVTEEDRLRPGDRILSVNGGSPASQRAVIQKNFFFSLVPEREDWSGLLKMADTIEVSRPTGAESLRLRKFCPIRDLFRPSITEHPDRLIIDLRNVSDLTDEDTLTLLTRVCRKDTPLKELIDTELLVSYTRLNCLVKAESLRGVEGAESFIAELEEKQGRGILPEDIDDGTVVPGRWDRPVIVLTDTWTRDGAEAFSLAAKRAGAILLGRPTLGTIDLCGDVSLELDDRYTLTWPTALAQRALDGNGVLDRGVTPDSIIPWTPEECLRDVLMEHAEEMTVN